MADVDQTIGNRDSDGLSQNGFEEQEPTQSRGAIVRPDGRICIGRVGAPPQQEANSSQFFFWVPPDVVVEKTQIVLCESEIAKNKYTFYGIVDEVNRRSRQRNMGGEVDEADGDLSFVPPFASDGYTYAQVSILRTEPPVLTSPRERSDVLVAGPEEAQLAYGADDIEHSLQIGVIKNGGSLLAGPGVIDLDYLLGVNGGHMNVNGSAGRGTKSSFLLWVIWMLLQNSRQQQSVRPSDKSRLRIVPIILNVKNFDLFYLDRHNTRFDPNKHLELWHQFQIDEPKPFQKVELYAAQQPGNTLPVNTGRTESVQAYSWSLSDIINKGLFLYLFAETDTNDVNFSALILDIENWLSEEKVNNDGSVERSLQVDRLDPPTFQGLLNWVKVQSSVKEDKRQLPNHHGATWKKLYRRLSKMLYESRGVLRRDDQRGCPLDLVRQDTSDPIVIDLAALAGQADLQRFVVATIFRQLVDARTGSNAVDGLIYLIMLDELNRFAPRGAQDPITQLIETVAAEMRSQGIILFGAQQQASKVSEKVIENSAIRVLGMSGSLELSAPVWRFLSDSARRKASSLLPDEKLIIQDNFREPMHVRIPFPVWAMNPREAQSPYTQECSNSSALMDE